VDGAFRSPIRHRGGRLGASITYTDIAEDMNYVPCWLKPWMPPLTRRMIHRADTKQMR